MRAVAAAVLVGIAVAAAWGATLPPPSPADVPADHAGTSGQKLATLHVQLLVSDMWVDATRAAPAGADPDTSKDWILDARMAAADPHRAEACSAVARSMHSRFAVPRSLDFRILFDPAAVDCAGAAYEVLVVGYGHTSLVPIDFDAASPGEEAAVLAFEPAGPPARGRVDGRGDGLGTAVDGAFTYELRVAASSVPLPDAAQVGRTTPWVVRVALLAFESQNPATRMGNDWFLDADLRAREPGREACAAQARSMHARFFTPQVLDLLVLDPGPCAGSVLALRLVPWLHLDDGLLDLGGAPEGPACTGEPFPPPGGEVGCEVVVDVPLVDGFTASHAASGLRDGRPPGAEPDAALAFRVDVARAPPEATLALEVDVAVGDRNPQRATKAGRDWNLDVLATGGAGACVAHARNSHSYHVPFRRVALTFYGPDAPACAAQPVRLDFAAYGLGDQLLDISPAGPADGGVRCPATTPAYQAVHVAQIHGPIERNLLLACSASVTWHPARGPAGGVLDGAADGFREATDARLAWSVAGVAGPAAHGSTDPRTAPRPEPGFDPEPGGPDTRAPDARPADRRGMVPARSRTGRHGRPTRPRCPPVRSLDRPGRVPSRAKPQGRWPASDPSVPAASRGIQGSSRAPNL